MACRPCESVESSAYNEDNRSGPLINSDPDLELNSTNYHEQILCRCLDYNRGLLSLFLAFDLYLGHSPKIPTTWVPASIIITHVYASILASKDASSNE